MNVAASSVAAIGPLASHPLLQSIRDALRAGPQANETVVFLVGLAAFLLLIVVAARLFSRERGAAAEPQADYLTLAVDLLELSESDRHDLQRVARKAELEHPVAMLLSPANLARASAPLLSVEKDRDLRRRLERLCLRLFDVPLPDPKQLPPEAP